MKDFSIVIRKRIFKLLTYFANPRKVKFLLCLMNDGYLFERGWLQAQLNNQVIDKKKEPIPWISYPALDFLKQCLPADVYIFEYGCGFSTVFYAKNYKNVTAVENNSEWFKKITSLTKEFKNCNVLFQENLTEYINAIENSGRLFDLIVVDGASRNECLEKSLNFLSPGGLLVLDDADRPEYREVIELVKSKGFLSIPFIGMSALSYEHHNTTIFFKR